MNEERDIPTILAVLATTPLQWLGLCTMLPRDLLERPAATGEWSAIDCLGHLMDTERGVFPHRVRAILAGQDFPDFDPAREGSQAGIESPSAMATEFAELRRQSLALLGSLSAVDLERTGIHGELGRVNMRQLLHEWASHDLNHTVQAERSLMQPFIAQCGPWRPYFQDHDLGERN